MKNYKLKNDKVIFLIPFAGGSIYSMKGLVSNLKGVDTIILELPGRGKRINENLTNNLEIIINDLSLKINKIIENYQEYFIYGHSMGALLGYLLIKKNINVENHYPAHFFVSGNGGPSREKKNEQTYLLPSKEFRKKIEELGGVTEEVIEQEELMTFFEPILRSDFSMVESFEYEKTEMFDIAITCFYGSEDDVTLDEIKLWQNETKHPIDTIEYPGKHFFIFDFWEEIAKNIVDKIHN